MHKRCRRSFGRCCAGGLRTTNYFANRTLPPSKLLNRVLIAIQNPGALSQGALQIVDAYYDERSGYNGTPPEFVISGYSGQLPVSIQNMPEEQLGAVYAVGGNGNYVFINYGGEKQTTNVERNARAFLQHLRNPQRAICFCGQSELERLHRS